MNKVYKKIASHLDALNKRHSNEVKKCKDLKTGYEDELKKLKDSLKDADVDTVAKFLDENIRLENVIKYLDDKLSELESEHLISLAEYSLKVNDVRAEQKRIADTEFKRMVSTINELSAIYESMCDEINEGNDIIVRLNHASGKPNEPVIYTGGTMDFMRNCIGRFIQSVRNNPAHGDLFKNH